MKRPKCWICMDEGFLLFPRNGYETMCRCTCPAGAKWTYDGRQCSKNKSDYYIQSVEELFDVRDIARANLGKYMEHNKDDAETKALYTGGHGIDNNADKATG